MYLRFAGGAAQFQHRGHRATENTEEGREVAPCMNSRAKSERSAFMIDTLQKMVEKMSGSAGEGRIKASVRESRLEFLVAACRLSATADADIRS